KDQLVEGENKIRIEAKRGASPDGLVLTMFAREPDGKWRRLDTDGSWQVVGADGGKRGGEELFGYSKSPWGGEVAAPKPAVTEHDVIKVPDGFQGELLHALDEPEGSWVSLCTDGKGRLIASDAGGRMVRIPPAPIGGDLAKTKIDPIDLPVGHANGLLWAFDS